VHEVEGLEVFTARSASCRCFALFWDLGERAGGALSLWTSRPSAPTHLGKDDHDHHERLRKKFAVMVACGSGTGGEEDA